MPDFSFDFANALQAKIGEFADRLGRGLRDDLRLGQSFGGGGLHPQPGAEAVLLAPNAAHLRARIACYQSVLPVVIVRPKNSKRRRGEFASWGSDLSGGSSKNLYHRGHRGSPRYYSKKASVSSVVKRFSSALG